MSVNVKSNSQFIAFDGEGAGEYPHNYFLLAVSDGSILCNYDKSQLELSRVLAFLGRYEGFINVWYAFNYDMCMIFRDLPRELQEALFHDEEITFEGYRLRYIPRKLLTIVNPDGVRVVHYDVFGFFQGSFIKTLEEWNVYIPSIIREGKAARADFDSWDVQRIINYNNSELLCLLELMGKLTAQLEANDIFLESWHGAGALASHFLTRWGYKNLIHSYLPEGVKLARRAAYYGGRIELFKRGYYSDLYHYDINSAYPDAMRLVPDLRKGKWKHIKNPTIMELQGKFGLVKLSWKCEGSIGCFPFRLKDGYVIYPLEGSGWYHIVEALAALKFATVRMYEAWIFHSEGLPPLYEYITETARRKGELKQMGGKRYYPLKLGLNALYGKTAQKPSAGRPSAFRELLYAGYITAYTRAKLLPLLSDDTILVSTDGLISRKPIDVPLGDGLGEWTYEHVGEGLFLLAGVYRLDGVNKTRGYKPDEIDLEKAWEGYKKGQLMSVETRRFVGIRMGLKRSDKRMCFFDPRTRLIDPDNNAKRIFAFADDESTPNNDLEGATVSYPYSDGSEDSEHEDAPYEVSE